MGISRELNIGRGYVPSLIHDCQNFRKITPRWVPKQGTEEHKQNSLEIAIKHLLRYHNEENALQIRSKTQVFPINWCSVVSRILMGRSWLIAKSDD
jgi:hypothetical protein